MKLVSSQPNFSIKWGALKRLPYVKRWATKVLLLPILSLFGTYFLISPNAFAGQIENSCLSKIPLSLGKVLVMKYSEFRLPHALDGEPSQVKFSRKQGLGDCVLVTTGDFDGNGLTDIAVLLPHRHTKKVILVSALRRRGGWSIYQLPTSCKSISNCYVATSPPGTYEMTQSFDYTSESPNSRARISSINQVVESGIPESTSVIHAYVQKHWQYVWVSD